MGACGSSRQGPAQPQQAMCTKDVTQHGMPNDVTLLGNRTPDFKKQQVDIQSGEIADHHSGAQEQLDSPLSVPDERPRPFGRAVEDVAIAKHDDSQEQALADTDDKQEIMVTCPPAKPDFNGEWKMVRYEGDFETWLKEAGVGWASRKAASAAGFGVNGTFASIQGTEEQIRIQSKSIKGTTLQELKLDGSEQDDKDIVHGTPIRVIPHWEDIDGKTVLTVEAPASKNKSGTVSTPLTKRYIDGDSMTVERTNASGTLVRLVFVKEG